MKNRSKITTIFLVTITILMVGLIFYISLLLTKQTEPESSPITPRKTKAANVTYSKLITLNQTNQLPDTVYNEQEDSIATEESKNNLSNQSFTLQEQTLVENNLTPTPTEVNLTPTPTEIILAYNSTDKTSTSSANESKENIEESPTITKTKTLPESGIFYQSLFIFAAAVVLIFFSFLF